MAEWIVFPLAEQRPIDIKRFSKKERPELELVIAQQVSDLMSLYGTIDEVEVDLGDCPHIEELKTYQAIELERVLLEDDSELVINQFPYAGDGFFTAMGAHEVAIEGEDGEDELSLTIWDPKVEVDKRITDTRGKKVSRYILQELYEALTVVTMDFASNFPANNPPLAPHMFPVAVIEPEFEALALQFES